MAPITQTGVVPEQRFEQRPHVSTDVRSASHPFTGLPSQSARPDAQVSPHTPPEHVAVDDGPDGHTIPHAPQCDVDVRRFTSQPLPGLPSQSAKPAMHAVRHAPATQATSALGPAVHTAPHAPQFITFESVLASQPLVLLPSQSPKPGVHERPHAPRLHTGVALVAPRQTVPQVPQLVIESRRASHPLVASPSQSAKPVSHVNEHRPAAHARAEFARSGHTVPHPPQLSTLVCVLTQAMPHRT